VSGNRSDAFHGIVRRFGYFRQFSPTMLSALEFFPDTGQTSSPCMEAIEVLRKMNTEQHSHKKVQRGPLRLKAATSALMSMT